MKRIVLTFVTCGVLLVSGRRPPVFSSTGL